MRLGRILACCAALALTGASDPSIDGPVRPPPMEGEKMALVGIGNAHTCRGYLEAFDAEMQARPPGTQGQQDGFMTPLFGALMAWSDGYITARNEVDRLQREAGINTNFLQRGRWLQLFCQANPNAMFYAAVYRLREHLVAEGL